MNEKETSRLGNPNDDSIGNCYAPVDGNGDPIDKNKRHIPSGKDIPKGWIPVPCDNCHLNNS